MRVNVYAEELRERVTIVHKEPKNAPGVIFSGIEFLVGDEVMHTPGDDDSSAVTFYYNSEYTRSQLKTMFTKALDLLETNPPK
jgi:hypothetical protein